MTKYLYRLEPHGRGGTSCLRMRSLPVARETEKGFWLVVDEENKFVKRGSRASDTKRFAWETKEDALLHFIGRKRSHINHLEHFLADVRRSLVLAEECLARGEVETSYPSEVDLWDLA